jgi:hypothetical protein
VKLADAHRLLYAQKFDSAQAAYQELIGRFPQSAEAYLGLSMACRYSGHRDTALKLDSEAVGAHQLREPLAADAHRAARRHE